jgi:Spy/CpxP family protein refolding chaperone
MKHHFLATTAILAFATTMAYADEPSPPADNADQLPRTHVDTTVVGDAVAEGSSAPSGGLDNDHDFHPGAPELVSATKRLNLSPHQEAQVKDAIERADAGAAVLIKHEHDVRQMLAATTPQDPLYATLISDQSANSTRWSRNREGLRQEIISILTTQQRISFQEMQAQR